MACVTQAVTIDLVTVGNPGNAASSQTYDPADNGPDGAIPAQTLGDVAYSYQIGRTEVTVPQYIEFLNAVAATDPNGLYHGRMATFAHGGINQNGADPNFTYSIKDLGDNEYANKPAGFIRYYQAVRFANWMHNGQLTGAQDASTTENGSYDIAGTADIDNQLVPRTSGATWVLPTLDEWTKAAFHSPGETGGTDPDYFDNPTSSHSAPGTVTVDANGDVTNSATANIANLFCGTAACNWNGTTTGNLVEAGGAGPLSASPYGILDAAGNANEWIESISSVDASHRATAGKSYGTGTGNVTLVGSTFLGSSGGLTSGSNPREDQGMRMVLIPEPAALGLLGVGIFGLILAVRKLRRH